MELAVTGNEHGAICLCLTCTPSSFGLGRACGAAWLYTHAW